MCCWPSASPSLSIGGVVPIGAARMDPSSPPLTAFASLSFFPSVVPLFLFPSDRSSRNRKTFTTGKLDDNAEEPAPMRSAPVRNRRGFFRETLHAGPERVATVSAFLPVGFCRWEKATVNHRTIDRGYRLPLPTFRNSIAGHKASLTALSWRKALRTSGSKRTRFVPAW